MTDGGGPGTGGDAPAAKARPLRWSLTAAAAGAAMVLTYVGFAVFDGGSETPAGAVASDSVTDRPLHTNSGDDGDDHDDRDGPAGGDGHDDEDTDGAAGRSAAAAATGSGGSTGQGSTTTSTPRPSPTTWAQEVLSAGPDDPIRLTPVASDWSAEQIIVGQDAAGKFLGRVTVRYSGPGAAQGAFALTLIKDGREITRLVGELVEVRSGTYQVVVSSDATWSEGPWTTQFRVISTS